MIRSPLRALGVLVLVLAVGSGCTWQQTLAWDEVHGWNPGTTNHLLVQNYGPNANTHPEAVALRAREAQRYTSNRDLGRQLAAQRGWGADQFGCLDRLWTHESNWETTADNPRSSAYGIPQALPGSKMSSHGADWRTSARTQILWGLDYIAGRYGTPCSANAHALRTGWY